ncbi:hypothetical protein PGT21_034323 [Puccinia graminis f. sp. tritici]|uniref:Uncharacterized protein n=1 Tax=Puccinia graminis f. sp. tritici TaxID=56615 RepID=A0A5B0P215_PUCGR|nr:hypothetical protein PGTUg99_020539 [Puccinia graminis f. sp. tritici]KAA1094996.1 hypothetical protein PGT21_034323 [Puccinia graminis f. sp. tritici]
MNLTKLSNILPFIRLLGYCLEAVDSHEIVTYKGSFKEIIDNVDYLDGQELCDHSNRHICESCRKCSLCSPNHCPPRN